jgi:hypothetical protein
MLATWQTPQGLAAQKDANIVSRISHYRFELTHVLKDGSRVIPNVTTIQHVLSAFDQFGPDFPVAVSVGSYEVYEEEDNDS